MARPFALPPEATGAFDTKGAFDPVAAYGIRIMHIAAIAIAGYIVWRLPELFSWTLLIVTVVFVLGPILGVTSTFHRGETHGAFQWAPTRPGRAARWVGLFWGHLAFQKTLIDWALMHRVHHKFVDAVGWDPHTPMRYTRWSARKQRRVPTLAGFLWSHYRSFEYEFIPPAKEGARYRAEEAVAGDDWEARLAIRRHHWVSDLEQDPVLVAFERWYVRIVVLRFALPIIIMALHGYLAHGTLKAVLLGALDGGLVAGVLGVAIVWNITWCTNSVAHIWGDWLEDAQHFKVVGFARNVWYFFLAMLGENWHRRHHRMASSAAHGWRFYEVDFTKYFIGLLQLLRLVVKVKWMRAEREAILAEEAAIRRAQAELGRVKV